LNYAFTSACNVARHFRTLPLTGHALDTAEPTRLTHSGLVGIGKTCRNVFGAHFMRSNSRGPAASGIQERSPTHRTTSALSSVMRDYTETLVGWHRDPNWWLAREF
jgi:hypothetical protein